VDLCNVDGMTPLMLAASFGDCILVNVSYCVIVVVSVLCVPSRGLQVSQKLLTVCL